jgi:hypothetical protein
MYARLCVQSRRGSPASRALVDDPRFFGAMTNATTSCLSNHPELGWQLANTQVYRRLLTSVLTRHFTFSKCLRRSARREAASPAQTLNLAPNHRIQNRRGRCRTTRLKMCVAMLYSLLPSTSENSTYYRRSKYRRLFANCNPGRTQSAFA